MNTQHLATLIAGAFTPWLAQAHEGHGLSGGHWHATDSILWIALAVGLGLWWYRQRA